MDGKNDLRTFENINEEIIEEMNNFKKFKNKRINEEENYFNKLDDWIFDEVFRDKMFDDLFV